MAYTNINRNISGPDFDVRGRDRHHRGVSVAPTSKPEHFGLLEFVSFFALCAIALAYRLDFLFPNNFVVDADEAIVGLMAKHINEGAPVPIFYYGQHYMGSLEPYLTSLAFKLFGVSSISLKIVPLAFSLLLIPVMFQLGVELGNRRVGWLAAIFAAVPPVALTIWSAKARGGFIEILFLGSYALLLAIRFYKSRDYSLVALSTLAFVLGFGWWTNNQVIFFVAPCGFAVLSKLLYFPFRNRITQLNAFVQTTICGLLFFILGGLPFWIYNLKHHFVSFQMFRQAESRDIGKHLTGMLETSIPILFGAKHLWEKEDIMPHASLVAYAVLLFGLISFCLTYRKDMLQLLLLKLNPQKPVGIIPIFLLASFAAFVLSSFGHLVQAPRYLLPTYVGFFLLYALVFDRIGMYIRGAVPILTILLLSTHLASAYVGGRAMPGEPIVYHWDRVAKDHQPLIEFLNSKGYRWVRTNYWIGYRLAFETKESIRFLVFQEPHQTRIPSYKTEGRAAGEDLMPLVLTVSQAPLVETALTALGYRYTRAQVSDYVVLHELRYSQENLSRVPSSAFMLHATSKDEVASLAGDEDESTRWGSGEPQKPGMEFRVEFREPTTVRALKLNLASWETDFPRGLQVSAKLGDDSEKVLLTPSQYQAALYYLNHNSVFTLMFEAIEAKTIVLTETDTDPVFDWSIAELEVKK